MSDKLITDIIQPEIDRISKAIYRKCKKQWREDEFQASERTDRWTEMLEAKQVRDITGFDKPVLVVVVTPKTEESYKDTEEYERLEKLIYLNSSSDPNGIVLNLDLEIVSENKQGLPEVYNRFLTEQYEEYYVCFIHDDVLIDDIDLFNKLQQAHRTAEIVGVAGATKIELPFDIHRPTLWHTLSRNPALPPQSRVGHFQSGMVVHPVGENRVYASAFGPTPQICRLIDGLFMSFDIAKCRKYNFSFDERFTFHHYDLSACLIAANCGLNITTWPISITHKSLGDPNNDEWRQSHKKFVQVYKDFR